VDCDRKRQIVRIVGEETVANHSRGQTISSFTHIEGMTMGAGGEVDEVARVESSMDRIGDFSDRACEGQADGVYGKGFTSGSLASAGAKDGRRSRRSRVVPTRSY
jgi:hypothetical protein